MDLIMNDIPHEIAVEKQVGHRWKPGQSGNIKGKPRGIKSRANQLMDKLFSRNPQDLQDIVSKTIALAKAGEGWAAQAILSRLWPVPKGALMQFPLPPIKTAADVAAAQEGLLQAVANGQITAGAAVELSGIVTALGKALESSELESRILKLEALAQRGSNR